MKKRFSLVSVVVTALLALSVSSALAAAPPAPAEDHQELGGCCGCPPDPIVTGDVYVGPMNKYVFRGNDLSFNQWVTQGGVDLTYRQWTLSYWTNYQARNSARSLVSAGTAPNRGISENDIYINYVYNPWWSPTKTDGTSYLQFNVGNNLYDYENVTTNELYLKATLQMMELLNPTFQVYWDWDKSTRAGLYYTASVSYKYDIERNFLDATAGALVSYNQRNWNAATNPNSNDPRDGAYNAFHDYELTAGVDWMVNGHVTITPSYQFSDALSRTAHDLGGIRAQHNFGIKAQFSF
jgi:hypothetical protein